MSWVLVYRAPLIGMFDPWKGKGHVYSYVVLPPPMYRRIALSRAPEVTAP